MKGIFIFLCQLHFFSSSLRLSVKKVDTDSRYSKVGIVDNIFYDDLYLTYLPSTNYTFLKNGSIYIESLNGKVKVIEPKLNHLVWKNGNSMVFCNDRGEVSDENVCVTDILGTTTTYGHRRMLDLKGQKNGTVFIYENNQCIGQLNNVIVVKYFDKYLVVNQTKYVCNKCYIDVDINCHDLKLVLPPKFFNPLNYKIVDLLVTRQCVIKYCQVLKSITDNVTCLAQNHYIGY